MKIPFDLKFKNHIISGKCRVQTKSGYDVRIVCWDVKNGWREDDIVGLVKMKDSAGTEYETVMKFYTDGRHLSDGLDNGYYDLLIIIDD